LIWIGLTKPNQIFFHYPWNKTPILT
jgi:hypothetical protein